jgi:ribonuclease BN (tRNA processing enzyme)
MKLRVLGCSGSKGLFRGKIYRPAAYLLNDRIALDAGCLLDALDEEERVRIDDILLSHAHLDHVSDAIMLPEATYMLRDRPVTVHGPMDLLFLLDDLYENCFAPFHNADKITINGSSEAPVQFSKLEAGLAKTIGPFRVTPCRVNHPAVSYGYLIEDEASALFYAGDTGPTTEMWSLLAAFTAAQPEKRLTVFIDVKFPNRLPDLALASGHYTPVLLEKDLQEKFELTPQVQLLATHLSPRYPELVDEIRNIRLRGYPPGTVGLVEQDRVYEL